VFSKTVFMQVYDCKWNPHEIMWKNANHATRRLLPSASCLGGSNWMVGRRMERKLGTGRRCRPLPLVGSKYSDSVHINNPSSLTGVEQVSFSPSHDPVKSDRVHINNRSSRPTRFFCFCALSAGQWSNIAEILTKNSKCSPP